MEREYPPYAIAAVGCVVLRGEEILLVKRGHPPSAGHWSIPGGVVEASESIYEAAMRELEEETGLRARPYGIVAVADVATREDGRVKYRYVILDVYFDPSTIEGDPRPGGDVVDVKWFRIREALSRSDTTRSTRKLIELIDRGEYCIVKTIQF